jgi:adenine/guanine phosphoribosyltransferase-like PRPP-binding protein
VIDLLTARIRDVPDFPKPGIVFKDLTGSLLVRDAKRTEAKT